MTTVPTPSTSTSGTTRDESGNPLVLPAALERRLREFRGRVWRIKLVEGVCAAVAGVLAGFLVLFVIDRLTEPPAWVRPLVFAAAVAGCAAVPLAFQRWIWRQRSLDQVARLIARRFPNLGDELLGIIEIVREAAAGRSLGKSRQLCAAAIGQVAARAETVDFQAALPPARARLWAVLAALPLLAAGGLAVALPSAAANTWARFLQPWRAIDRFTFTRIEPLPARIVVPLGEPATLDVTLAAETQRRPRAAKVTVGRQRPLIAAPDAPVQEYSFALPPQLEAAPLALAVGDVRARTWLEPMLRPEIASVAAEIRLPEYLGRPDLLRQDVRGGTITTVVGSDVKLAATTTRDLAAAHVDGAAVAPQGAVIQTPVIHVAESTAVAIEWVDAHGLAGLRPLEVAVVAKPDAPPTVALVDAPPNRSLLLDSDTLRFQVAARDDFGIRRVGIQWEGVATEGATAATKGDRLLAPGGSEQEALDVAATFCPQALGISPQPIVLRAFAEDFLPGRSRVYSSPVFLYIVDKGEHALVMNERLNRWRQQAGEVRDREMQLLATNRELRRLPEEKLLEDQTRRSVESQAAAESANARRLDRLVDEGAGLVREALKNPEFEAATLDQLAADIQTLADIADNRMPGVADLLREAARAKLATATGKPTSQEPAGARDSGTEGKEGDAAAAPGNEQVAEGKPAGEQPPKVGEERAGPAGGQSQSQEPGEAKPPVPQVVDRESSQQPPGAASEQDGTKKPGSGQGRLGLPTTQAGVAPPKPPRGDEPMDGERAADEALDEAIANQEALLAEFAKVADDLAAVMARLEGSTFVKRFKLASREQGALGSRIAGFSAEAFGQPDERPLAVVRAVGGAVESSSREVDKMSNLLDDMQAYFDRRQLPAFRTVLEEMKELDALGSLRALTDDIRKEAGMSIAQTEFWSDTFDRLADELVPPPGECQDCQGKGAASLPPEVVLEAMRILDAEVNLREETRVAQQARGALDTDAFAARARELAEAQEVLADRVAKLSEALLDAPLEGPLFRKDAPLFGPLEIPDGREMFRQEIALFDRVEEVMVEAAGILGSPDTGPRAIGAETEAIELLLASQAAGGGGGGGGGGGSSAGGGSTGSTQTPALALVGRGARAAAGAGEGEKEQTTGTGGRVLPEEFRAGLDAYFNRFEQERP